MTTLFLAFCAAIGDGRVRKPDYEDRSNNWRFDWHDKEKKKRWYVMPLGTERFGYHVRFYTYEGEGVMGNGVGVKVASPEHLLELLETIK